jgi:hypothetical protein
LNNASRNRLRNLPEKIKLNLFQDVELAIDLEKSSKTYYKNLEVYRGKSQDPRFAHLAHYRDVIIIFNPHTGNITAQIETDKGSFQISPTKNGSLYEVREWTADIIDCQDYYERVKRVENQAKSRNNGCNERDSNGKYVADLFVAYSQDAAGRVNDVDAHALSLTEMVNNGLTNSLVANIYVRLVGTGISEHNPGVVTSVLGDVWDWFEDEIALTGADYVASIQVPTGGNNEAGGWAGVGGYSSVNSIYGAAAVFRHELGHNVGSSHCTPGILPYAAGYNNGNVRTHMCGNNINFYSTPLVNDVMGVPIGDAATADNARVWRERAPIVSARRKHTILFDANDTGCGQSNLVNGRYYIQNLNSNGYIATENGSGGNGTNITQASTQSTNNQWDLISVDLNAFRMIHVNSGRYIDVPGGSNTPGRDMILWNAHGGSNQVFRVEEVGTDTFIIKAHGGQCLQIENAGVAEGDPIEQNSCDNSNNIKWRFIEVPNSNVLQLNVNTTDINCFGDSTGMATATATGGTGNYTYTWSNGQTGTMISNLKAGNYSLTIDDGTTNFPYAFSIKQVAPFGVNIVTTQATNKNVANSSASITVMGGTAPYSYTWSNGNTTATVNNLTAGVHRVTITDDNSCSLEKEIIINCANAFEICDDGNPNTVGDHIDKNCNCTGRIYTCDNGMKMANIAKEKPSSQSSISGGRTANLAVDGNRDGVFNNGSVTSTQKEENPWWQVDLEDIVDIKGVLINNRTDCCTGRLEDFYVFISEQPFVSSDLNATLNQAGVWRRFYQDSPPLPDFLVDADTTGRYVRIQLNRETYLNLAEVEVYACGVPQGYCLTANALGNNLYELKGYVINNGANINQLNIAYGSNDFSNKVNIDTTGLGNSDTFYISTTVDVGNAETNQFRIEIKNSSKDYYSSAFQFTKMTDYCLPTADNNLWYKRFNEVQRGNLNYKDEGNTNYDNQTSFSFGSFDIGGIDTFIISHPSSWANLTYFIYVDLNGDNDFTDYNELIGTAPANGGEVKVGVQIPTEDVLIGERLRMRILGNEGGTYTTCHTNIGNFKDFSIQINAAACTGRGYLKPFYHDMDGDGFGNPDSLVLRNCKVNEVTGFSANRLDCNDANDAIHPNAQEICDDGIDNNCDGFIDNANIAINKTAQQSSDLGGGVAARAVDGNTSGVWGDRSVTHTLEENHPYWEVDLGASYDLDSIVIWNRTDCCENRLRDYYVFLSDSAYTSNDPAIIAGQAGVWSQLSATHPTPSTAFYPNSSGRYLRIQIARENAILSLAEVQAFTCVKTPECTFYADTDKDGYGNPLESITRVGCIGMPVGYVKDSTDFDDSDWSRYPGALEICDGIDNNNNGQIDEGTSYASNALVFENEQLSATNYISSTTINTNAMVQVAANARVRFIAKSSIQLNAGFLVPQGSEFIARIVPDCNDNAIQDTPIPIETNTPKIITNTSPNTQISALLIAPNPFRTNATIHFHLAERSPILLQVFDTNGQLIKTLVNATIYEAGQFSEDLNIGEGRSGMYYVILSTAKQREVKKVVVLGNR